MIEYLDGSNSPVGTPSDPAFTPLVADIVAVHGLKEGSSATWTDPRTGTHWLRDLFPHQSYNTRILSFSYQLQKTIAVAPDRLLSLATNLVGELCAERDMMNATQRPLIFVCHGFGGLIVKRALAYSESRRSLKVQHLRDIHLSTYGIIFFGTPHRGIDKETLLLRHEHNGLDVRGPSQLELSLIRDSELLQDLEDQFAPMTRRLAIFNLWEGERTSLGEWHKYIVDKESAAPSWPHAESNEIPASHDMMTKFVRKSSPGYLLVFSALSRYIKRAGLEIPARWKEDYESLQNERYHEAEALVRTWLPQKPSLFPKEESQNAWFFVPRGSSKYFVGRGNNADIVRSKLDFSRRHELSRHHHIFVIVGLGGAGKTQFCLRYAEDNRPRYWGIFWIDASSNETADAGFASLGQQAQRGSSCGAGMLWLSQCTRPWLLILDNADDPDMDVSKYLPVGSGGHVLVTTRNPRVMEYSTAGHMRFSGMDPEEGLKLLLTTAFPDTELRQIDEKDHNVAHSIASELGYLALALANAGTAIRLKIYTLEKYLYYYLGHRKRTIASHNIASITDADIVTTWEIPFQRIVKNSNRAYCDAVDLLHILAFLHFESTPESIFRQSRQPVTGQAPFDDFVDQWVSTQQSDLDLELRLRACLSVLSSHSLVDHDMEKRVVSLHPVVQRWAKDRLADGHQRRWLDAALSFLAHCISPNLEPSGRKFRRALIPHIEACLKNLALLNGAVRVDSERRAAEINMFALVFAENGHWKRSRIYQEDIVIFRHRSLGRFHPKTIEAQRSLAESNWNLFDLKPVLSIQSSIRWTLLLSRPKLSDWAIWPPWYPRHVSYCLNLSDLTLSLWLAGNRELSKWTGQRAVRGLNDHLGPDDPLTLTAKFNLGRTLMHLGEHEESLQLLLEVLRKRKRLFGHEHPDTLMARNELGVNFCFSRKSLAVGERIIENTLTVRKRVLGAEHAYTLWSMNDVAKVYSTRNRHQKAIELLEEVLPIARRTLGDSHAGVFMTESNLARAYVRAERWTKAGYFLHDLRTKIPEEHPNYVHFLSGYVYVLIATNQLEQAETECVRVLRSVKLQNNATLHSPRVISIAEYLSIIYQRTGREGEIEALRERYPSMGAVCELKFSIWDV